MNDLNVNLKIAKDTSEMILDDMTGTLKIEATAREIQRNFNKLHGIHQIIKAIEGDEIET